MSAWQQRSQRVCIAEHGRLRCRDALAGIPTPTARRPQHAASFHPSLPPCRFHCHYDEAFSSLQIPHFKGFLRFHSEGVGVQAGGEGWSPRQQVSSSCTGGHSGRALNPAPRGHLPPPPSLPQSRAAATSRCLAWRWRRCRTAGGRTRAGARRTAAATATCPPTAPSSPRGVWVEHACLGGGGGGGAAVAQGNRGAGRVCWARRQHVDSLQVESGLAAGVLFGRIFSAASALTRPNRCSSTPALQLGACRGEAAHPAAAAHGAATRGPAARLRLLVCATAAQLGGA